LEKDHSSIAEGYRERYVSVNKEGIGVGEEGFWVGKVSLGFAFSGKGGRRGEERG